MTKYLHTMIRVTDPEATVAFFKLIGVEETRRFDNEAGRFTLIFLAAPGQEGVAEVELTYNWPPQDGSDPEPIRAAAISAISPIGSRIFTRPARPSWMPAIPSTAPRVTGTWPLSGRPTAFRSSCCRTDLSSHASLGQAWKIPGAGRPRQSIYGERISSGCCADMRRMV